MEKQNELLLHLRPAHRLPSVPDPLEYLLQVLLSFGQKTCVPPDGAACPVIALRANVVERRQLGVALLKLAISERFGFATLH